jgi:hypothetical protein
LVPLQHNHGWPIVKPKVPKELLRAARKAWKKGRRRAASAELEHAARGPHCAAVEN